MGAERLRRLAVLALALLGVSLAVARVAHRAEARPRPTLAANRALARRLAADLIGRVPLPPGATQVPTNPGSAVWLGSSVSGLPGFNLADVHRFWRVPGDPRAVFDWVKRNPPPGSHLEGTGTGGQNGATVAWFAVFSYPPIAGEIADRGIGIGVAAARGGGSAIRADAFAQWVIPRSPREVVPAGARRVAVTVDRFAGRAFPLRTVTAGRVVARLVSYVDSRPVVQFPATPCPAIGSFSRLLDLRFEAAGGGPPLARTVEDACGGLAFFVRGHRERALIEGEELGDVLWRMHVLPACRADQLSASATRPSREPRAIVAELTFRDVSADACALRGFGRVRLAGADGRGVGSPVRDAPGGAGAVVLLTPADSAVIALNWAAPGRSCRGPRPVRVDVALPGRSGRYHVNVTSWPRRLAPCHSAITADSLS